MFRAFSFPMKAERGRNKQRLEASLAGLCELELLKQRQECLVLGALCLGDPGAATGHGRPAWGDLRPDSTPSAASEGAGFRRQSASSLQCTPWGLVASLEQQVAELRVNAEPRPADSPTDPAESRLAAEILVSNQDALHDSGSRPIPALSSLTALCPPLDAVAKRAEETEAGKTWILEPQREAEVGNDLENIEDGEPTEEDYQQAQRVETYISGLIQRRALPQRPSKPRTNLGHDPRAVIVARQNSLCRKEEQQFQAQGSIQELPGLPTSSQSLEGPPPQGCRNTDQACPQGPGFTEDSPHPYHHIQHSTKHHPGLYPRPRQQPLANTPRSTSLDYSPCRVLQAQQDSSNSEPDSPQHFRNYHSQPLPPIPLPHSLPPPEEQLVNAEYIPAQPCRASTRSSAHPHSNSLRGSGGSKPSCSAYSPDRGHPQQEQHPSAHQIQHSKSRATSKKCRLSEDRGGATRKPGKKACRSQSENSLQRVPERKYSTVERDGGGSGSGGGGSRSSHSRGKKPQQSGEGHRRWRSTVELSQDESDQPPTQMPPSTSGQKDHCGRRSRKSRQTHLSYSHSHPYPHHSHTHQNPIHHHQHVEYQLEREQMPPSRPDDVYGHQGRGESESSTSEADSPDSSSLSSDSDESGGLVWPQQLPPQLSLPSPPVPADPSPLQPKAFVKIKASHALKKKILRFRTGSLKVMTTV